MNNFFVKTCVKKYNQAKNFLFKIIKSGKKRKIFIFGLFIFIILVSLIFFWKNLDRFYSVDSDLEEINMTGLPMYVKHEVLFMSQAPSKQWHSVLYQDACEEASIIMATHWITGEKDDVSVGKAEQELEKLFKISKEKHGSSIDMSAEDTAELLREYSDSNSVEVVYDATLENVIRTLADGRIIIVPADGEWLDNKYFAGAGPERHMVVIIGYDYKKKKFITNDPGTNRGKDFRYTFDNLMSSLRDYQTGKKLPIDEERRAMIIVGR
ncbi:MAG: C39 family peptidase [Candidatus Moranbacteria bacterium]|nr:C39 family peptidase [Candidatus Moranbacteria bacterium]